MSCNDIRDKKEENIPFEKLSPESTGIYFSNIITATIFLFVITQGCGYGVLSIIRPTVISEILGRRDFGIISGILATGFVLGSAMGPILGSIIWLYGGYESVIFIAILIPVLAIISIIGAWKFKL